MNETSWTASLTKDNCCY